MGKKVRHWVDTDKIYNVHIEERRKKTYIIFTAKIDGKKINNYDRLILEYQVRLGEDITFEVKNLSFDFDEEKEIVADEDVVISAEFVRNDYYFALKDALTTATAISSLTAAELGI